MSRYVPSVDELKMRMEQKASGLPAVTVAQQTQLLQENLILKEQIAKLADRGRLTPTEFRSSIMLLLEEAKIHPVRELLDMYRDIDDMGRHKLTAEQRISIMETIMAYTLPKMKTVEISGEIDNNITVTIQRFDENAQGSTFEVPIRSR